MNNEDVTKVPPMSDAERPGRMFKGLRIRKGVTRPWMAEVLDVPLDHIIEYEECTRRIPAEFADRLAKLFDTVNTNFLYKE